MRLDSLTGLRWLAALLVFGNHALVVADGTALDAARPLMRAGVVGVSFFFVLSGFVLAWSSSTSVPARTFYRRRFARIAPSHWVALALATVLAVASSAFLGVGPVLASSVLVQSWIPSERYYFGGNGVAWSLSCELFFYATAPFLLPRLARLQATGRRALMACLVVVVALVAVLAPFDDWGSVNAWFGYVFPPVRLVEFLLGALLAYEVRAGRLPSLPLVVTGPLAFGAVLVAGVLPESYMIVSVTLVPFLVLIASAAQRDTTGGAGVLRSGPLVTLGVWSYAFYLLHEQVLREATRRLGPTPGATGDAVVVLASSLLASVALAAALYRFVERPAERLLRSGDLSPVTAALPRWARVGS